jgi:hypothetical protein
MAQTSPVKPPPCVRDSLRRILHYESGTGVFTWRVSPARNVRVGDIAGYHDQRGYRHIGIGDREYLAHRIAFFYMTGEWPPEIDHINRDPSDNRWSNLRAVTHAQNMANMSLHSNNTSTYTGVSWHKQRRKWIAQIRVKGRVISLGRYSLPEEARAAYVAASKKHFGEFAGAGG